MMLHHSNSRHQRNKGSRIKTLLQVTLLLGVVVWLLYQVKHSYDKKNEYLDDTEDQLAHDDTRMFQGRKEKAGRFNDGNAEKDGENSDVINKPEVVDHHSDSLDHHSEEKSGETVFEKDNTESHEDDVREVGKSEAEQGQVGNGDGNSEPHGNDADEATDHSEVDKHDAEFSSSETERSEVHSNGEDVPQNVDAHEESTGGMSGSSHEEIVLGDESTDADQTHASNNGLDGEEAENKEAVDSQTGTEPFSDDTYIGTTVDSQIHLSSNDEPATETLPDETGNIPSVHNEKSQKDASENQGSAASTTSDAAEDNNGETVHTETGSENEGITTSSSSDDQTKVVMPGDNEIPKREASESQLGSSVESNSSDNISFEGNTGTASANDEKGAEMGVTSEASGSKEANSEGGNSTTEVSYDQPANAEMESVQGVSDAGKVAYDSSEETKPVEDPRNGTTEVPHNSEQVGMKIETSVSTNDEHNQSQGDGSSGSNDNGHEQTGKSETQ